MAKKKNTLTDVGENTVKANNPTVNSEYAEQVNDYVKKCAELEHEGMTLLYAPDTVDIGNNIPTYMQEQYVGGGECLDGLGPVASQGGKLFLASYNILPMDEGDGAIPWGGIRNRMPLDIYNTSKDLPYSAAGLRYNFELMEGLGPKVVYKYLEIVNGVPKERTVPFEYAGVMLMERIKKFMEARNESGETRDESEGNNAIYGKEQVNAKYGNDATKDGYAGTEVKNYRVKKTPKAETVAVDYDMVGSADWQLEQAKKDYEEWLSAWTEMEEWLENNDLSDIYKRFIQDDIVCDLSFMRFNLNAETNGKAWNPKIVNIDNLPVVITRYEKRDSLGNINHVYQNDNWRHNLADRLRDNQGSVMYPVIGNVRMASNGSRGFKAQLKEYIAKPEKNKDGKRVEWLCTPLTYPSCENAYYPRPHWWSLYASLCVTYASTYFFDKAVARANSTQLKYAIYVNLDWLERLRSQQQDTVEPGNADKVIDFRQSVINKINSFLKNKTNNGKSITGDVFTDDKGNEHKSFQVVAVPTPKIETASTEELSNISSIFSWAMGIHGALQGDRPGVQKSSSGGTFQRELHLLAQGKMNPRQRLWCNFVEGVMKFNGWCPKHVGVVIKMPVLTTLDNEKTGIVDMES